MMEQRKNDIMMLTTIINDISDQRNHKNGYKQIQGKPQEESSEES